MGWDREIPTTMPAENITLKARWKDIEKPTGEIVIGTNKWQEFLNKLTFGLCFKDTQTVTINAADNSGTVFISYLVTDRDLSEAELQSLVFSGYEEPFCIDPSYIPKSGKKTPWIGYFWSGCAGEYKRGLEIKSILQLSHLIMM